MQKCSRVQSSLEARRLERGQIVLPAKLRKKFNINAGDKLLVVGIEHMPGVMVVKAELLSSALEMMGEHMLEFSRKIKKGSGK